MIITKHGYKRIKERKGLPKRAQERHILQVLRKGLLASRNGFDDFKMIYQDFVYIFSLTQKLEPIFVTTYKSSHNYLVQL